MRVCCANRVRGRPQCFRAWVIRYHPGDHWAIGDARGRGWEDRGQGPSVTDPLPGKMAHIMSVFARLEVHGDVTQASLPSALFSMNYCLLLTTPRNRD